MNNIRDGTQQEILNTLPNPCHGLLNLAPRVGKSKICISLLKREKVKKVLWVTPSTKLRDEDIPNEFIKWKAKVLLNNADIICYASLEEYKGNYDVIVLDEYQYITESNSQPLLNGRIKYKRIIGLSGTHPKHIEKQDILDKLNLKILVKVRIDEAAEKGLIADYNINIVTCETNNVIKNIKAGNKEKTWMQTEREAYNYLSKNIFEPFFVIKRMRFIYDSLTKEMVAKRLISSLNGRKMVFCASIKQAERLGNGNTYHSKRNNVSLQKFINKEIDDLYCVNSGGVGFTYEGVDDFIIIQANSDKKGETTQKLARSLLNQENGYKGRIWFICLVDTKDRDWLKEALQDFDETKIKVIKSNELENGIKQ